MRETLGSVRLFRLVKQKYARHALAGRGGLEADGRWNTAGQRIVYFSSSEALAVLEVRVHLGTVVPADVYALVTIELPRPGLQMLARTQWPRRWDAVPFVAATQQLGEQWLVNSFSLALRVPSVHSRSDFNVLLNPSRPDANRMRILSRARYEFDGRLF